jgi:protein HIRA/HIR1
MQGCRSGANKARMQSFNPRLFAEEGKDDPTSMVALGADDNSISIWKNSHTAPLVVVKDIFERQILDLSW